MNDEEELLDIYNAALKNNLVTRLIKDAGRTQIPAGSKTVLAIGPGKCVQGGGSSETMDTESLKIAL